MQDPPVVAVVGATGAAGGTLLRVLEDRLFPIGDFRALASARSAGSVVRFRDHDVPVAEVDDAALSGADLVFFAAGADTSRRFAPGVAAGGGLAVDKSSAYRLDPAVPLVVPEVNAAALAGHTGIVANPNCVTIPLAVVLAPLHARYGIRHVTVATYQAASGGGRALAAELATQERDDAYGRPPRKVIYPHVLHGNVVPGGWAMVGDDTEEEVKVTAELRKVLDLSDLPIAVTTVRVPVAVGHSAAVWIEFDQPAPPDEARHLLAASPGVLVVDDPETQQYPTPRAVAGSDEVHVGRIRADRSREHGLALFLAADNLRKGAATNAVQVAELLLVR
ncbi:MAG TPA: aspartate-semialdehyde dehydrogenase [Candidatus Dormibacteraeota bacterium]|nr:aspartate-semialdehyde dehydrogenase [Candidatus Dormibacteraeota bacterium]